MQYQLSFINNQEIVVFIIDYKIGEVSSIDKGEGGLQCVRYQVN